MGCWVSVAPPGPTSGLRLVECTSPESSRAELTPLSVELHPLRPLGPSGETCAALTVRTLRVRGVPKLKTQLGKVSVVSLQRASSRPPEAESEQFRHPIFSVKPPGWSYQPSKPPAMPRSFTSK